MPDDDRDDSPFDPAIVDLLLAWQSLELASRLVREEFADRAGLSLNDFQALVILSSRDGSSPKAVGAQLGLTTGAMTALIDRLEHAGYVTREPHPTDRRSTRLRLSQSGRASAAETGARYLDVVTAVVPPGEVARVTTLFTGLAAGLDSTRK